MEVSDGRPLVLHIIYAFGTGGLENGLVNIVNHPASRRYRHAILCLTRCGTFSQRITAEGVELIELDKKPGHDVRAYLNLVKVLRRLKPSVVHTRNLAAQEMQLLVALSTNAVRIHGEHGRDIYDLDGTRRKYLLLRKFLKVFIHHYIAVSGELTGWLIGTIKIPSGKVHQICNGVEQTRFRPDGPIAENLIPPGFIDHESIVIGTVGRLAAVKNQGLLLGAFASLVLNDPVSFRNLRLLMVGDGPLFPELEKQIERFGLKDKVWLAGDRNDVPSFLRSMDIFVLPSLAEGISNTVLEAMATGLPIVATQVGGNSELIENGVNGILVPSEDEEAMASVLQDLVHSPHLRKKLGAEALSRVRKKFDWQKATLAYLAVYDKALGVRHAQASEESNDNILSGK